MPVLNDALALYRGSTPITRIYRGASVIWPASTVSVSATYLGDFGSTNGNNNSALPNPYTISIPIGSPTGSNRKVYLFIHSVGQWDSGSITLNGISSNFVVWPGLSLTRLGLFEFDVPTGTTADISFPTTNLLNIRIHVIVAYDVSSVDTHNIREDATTLMSLSLPVEAGDIVFSFFCADNVTVASQVFSPGFSNVYFDDIRTSEFGYLDIANPIASSGFATADNTLTSSGRCFGSMLRLR